MNKFIGHNDIISGFMKRAENNQLSHAHLIIGADGIGKSIVARKFALKIMGKERDVDFVDIIHYYPSKASFGVDEVRGIIEEVNKKPYEGDKKVIIIHEGSKLTIQAQNALLKTIEEPPKGVYIILLSESLETLLDTIKSRCQIYRLTPLSKEEMIEYIDSLGEKEENRILAALAYGNGVPGRVDRFLGDEKLSELRKVLVDLLKDINDGKNIIIKYEDKFQSFKEEKEEILNTLTTFIRDIMIYKESENKELIINVDKIDDINYLSNMMSYKRLNSMLDYIQKTRMNLMSNTSYSLTMSVMLMGFLEG